MKMFLGKIGSRIGVRDDNKGRSRDDGNGLGRVLDNEHGRNVSNGHFSDKKLLNIFHARQKGETLIEVIIALTVVTLGAAAATNMTITAMEANQYNKDALMALNLAKEGIEQIKNLRDSNVLRYSANKAQCWHIKLRPDITTCTAASILQEGNYSSGKYLSASPVTAALNLSEVTGDASYELKYCDTNNDSAADLLSGNNCEFGYGTALGTAAYFYREINIDYKTTTSAGAITDATDSPNYYAANLMLVTSKVQWKDKGRVREIKLTSYVSNYKK